MFFGKKVRLGLFTALLATGAIACGGAPADSSHTQAATTGVVFYAPATQTSSAKLGVARWHGIVERGSRGVVIDGVDAKGNVVFVTALQFDVKSKTVRLSAFGALHGTMVVDYARGKVLSSTLPLDRFAPVARAFEADWTAHKNVVAYDASGPVSSGLAIVGGAASIASGIALAPFDAGASSTALASGLTSLIGSVGDAIATYQGTQAQHPLDAQEQEQLRQLEAEQQSTEKQIEELQPQPEGGGSQAAPTSSSGSASDPAQGSALPSDSPGNLDDSASGLYDPLTTQPIDPDPLKAGDPPYDPFNPPSETTLPNVGDPPTDPNNLPNGDPNSGPLSGVTVVGDQGSNGSGSDPGAGNDSNGDNGGGDTSSADNGGGDTSSADNGGGDTGGGDFAYGRCRKAMISKSTQIHACVHY